MCSGGILYTITDVEELHNWMVERLNKHPLFEALTEEEVKGDECAQLMVTETEEGKKAEREGRSKWVACYRRK